jgi:hypothetical protein
MYKAPHRTYAQLAAWLLGGLISMTATLLHAAPQAGWWWNANESGRGFFLEVQGPRMFMSGYFYSEDGRATWLVSNDPMPNPNAYDGRLLAFSNGQSLVGDYRHPGAAVDAGAVSLRFSDDRHGTLTWAGGTIAIERYDFQHGANATFQPKTGWWWNADESGRGFSIELQGDHMFIGAYMYDTNGNPVWYVADALMQSPTSFRGTLLQFANGQTLAGAYRAPTPPAIAGTLTVQFSATNQATVTLSDERPQSLGKAGQKTIIILPQYELHPVAPPKLAKFWVGGFDMKSVFAHDSIVFEYTVEVPVMTWAIPKLPDDLENLSAYPAIYKIESGFAVVSSKQTGADCVITSAKSVDLGAGDGTLTVHGNGSYTGIVSKTFTMTATQVCTEGTGTSTTTVELLGGIAFNMNGNLESGVMRGTVIDPGLPNVVFSGSWDFAPRF